MDIFFLGIFNKINFYGEETYNLYIKVFINFYNFLSISFSFNYSIKNINQDKFRTKLSGGKNYYENMMKFDDLINLKIPKNITLRLTIWKNIIKKL